MNNQFNSRAHDDVTIVVLNALQAWMEGHHVDEVCDDLEEIAQHIVTALIDSRHVEAQ